MLLDSDTCLYTQYMHGIYNWIANSLSQDFHILDYILSHLLTYCFPSQSQGSLEIFPLPSVITLFITIILEVYLM